MGFSKAGLLCLILSMAALPDSTIAQTTTTSSSSSSDSSVSTDSAAASSSSSVLSVSSLSSVISVESSVSAALTSSLASVSSEIAAASSSVASVISAASSSIAAETSSVELSVSSTSSVPAASTTVAPTTSAPTSATVVSSVAPTASANATLINVPFYCAGFNFALNKRSKRQVGATQYLAVNADNTVVVTDSCLNAAVFIITPDFRLQVLSSGFYASTTLAQVLLGNAALTVAPTDPTYIETTFSTPGGLLAWNNVNFANGAAIFGFPTAGNGAVEVAFNGALPAGYIAPTLQVLAVGSPEAAALGCPAAVASSSSASSSQSLTLSTVFTTLTYTVTACPATVTNCPLGSVTTEAVSVTTTYCPASATGLSNGIVIGVLISILIDISIEINIVNGIAATTTNTVTLCNQAGDLYDNGLPCYACSIAAEGNLASNLTVTQTLIRSPSGTAVPTFPVVYQTCDACPVSTIAAAATPASGGVSAVATAAAQPTTPYEASSAAGLAFEVSIALVFTFAGFAMLL